MSSIPKNCMSRSLCAPPAVVPVFVLLLGLFPNRLCPGAVPDVPEFEPAFGNSELPVVVPVGPVVVAGFAKY
jgi:hypothetical protein